MRTISYYLCNPKIYLILKHILNSLKILFPSNSHIFQQPTLSTLPYQNFSLRMSIALLCISKQSFTFSLLVQQIFIDCLAGVRFLGYDRVIIFGVNIWLTISSINR